MKSTRSKVCLSEINLGFEIGHTFMGVCSSSLTAKAFRELILGIEWQGPQAKEEKVVDELFTKREEAELYIKQFAKKFKQVGAMREGIKRNKEFYYQRPLKTLREETFDPIRVAKMTSGWMP